MSIFDKVRVKAQELLGRAEQVYGESHGDAAAEVAGEAHLMEAEAEEEALARKEHGVHPRDEDEEHEGARPRTTAHPIHAPSVAPGPAGPLVGGAGRRREAHDPRAGVRGQA